MNELCYMCDRKIGERKGDALKVETNNHIYAFCRQCLQDAMVRLLKIPKKSPEELKLFVQIKTFMKGKIH